MLSWGYLFHRAYTLQINLGPLLSRVPTASTHNHHTEDESTASNLIEEIRVTGRIVLNVWRLMRHEVFHTHAYRSVYPVSFHIWDLVFLEFLPEFLKTLQFPSSGKELCRCHDSDMKCLID
jgi:hypothetical protein